MGTIRATCPDCGDVDLQNHDVRVRVCIDTDEGEYRFRCPTCAMLTVKPASDRTVDLLMSAGVHMDEWRLPAELKETHAGLRICHDDIIDFHALLADDAATADALRRLAEA